MNVNAHTTATAEQAAILNEISSVNLEVARYARSLAAGAAPSAGSNYLTTRRAEHTAKIAAELANLCRDRDEKTRIARHYLGITQDQLEQALDPDAWFTTAE